MGIINNINITTISITQPLGRIVTMGVSIDIDIIIDITIRYQRENGLG